MGYDTTFKGELKFTTDLTAKVLAKVKTFLGEDCRDHKEWDALELTYIDLEFLEDFSGLRWSQGEKSYNMTEKLNVLIKNVKKEFPEFGLKGQFLAQGEDKEDRYIVKIENGIAVEKKIEIKGTKVTCPHCEEDFILDAE